MKSIHVLGAIFGFLLAGILVISIYNLWKDANGDISEFLFGIIALVVVGAIRFAIQIPFDKWWQKFANPYEKEEHSDLSRSEWSILLSLISNKKNLFFTKLKKFIIIMRKRLWEMKFFCVGIIISLFIMYYNFNPENSIRYWIPYRVYIYILPIFYISGLLDRHFKRINKESEDE